MCRPLEEKNILKGESHNCVLLVSNKQVPALFYARFMAKEQADPFYGVGKLVLESIYIINL